MSEQDNGPNLTWTSIVGTFKKQYNVTCHLCFKISLSPFSTAALLEFIFQITFLSQSSLGLDCHQVHIVWQLFRLNFDSILILVTTLFHFTFSQSSVGWCSCVDLSFLKLHGLFCRAVWWGHRGQDTFLHVRRDLLPLCLRSHLPKAHALHRALSSSLDWHYHIVFLDFASPLSFILRKWDLRRILLVRLQCTWSAGLGICFHHGFSDKELKLTKENET